MTTVVLWPHCSQEETVSSCTRGGKNWILGKIFFREEVEKSWNRLPREVVQSLFLGSVQNIYDYDTEDVV